MLQLDRATVDSCLYRLRKDPESADVRAGLFKSLAPIIRGYSSHCCLTEATQERLRLAVEELLVQQLPDICSGWFARPNRGERNLLARVRRAVAAALISFPPDPLARVVEDDLKLEQLRVWRREGDSDAVGRVLVGTLAACRRHFDNFRGRKYLPLAERCAFAIILRGRRPSWKRKDCERWGRHSYGDVREIYGMVNQWAREALADVLATRETP